MVLFPNAKINLGLHVTGRRHDGFHNIETVFFPVPLMDVLEMVKADDQQFAFTLSGIGIPADGAENLCVLAWKMLQKEFELPPVKIHLHKNIPTGAGLGGGSSDGAYMIRLINQYFSLHLADDRMEDYARRLGSDCPFFIRNRPVFATGRGDQFFPVNIDVSKHFLVIVKPPFGVSTREAYAGIRPAKPAVDLRDAIRLPIVEWRGKIINDFEVPVFKKHPEIAAIKSKLYDLGALFSLMSGSGSAVYALFDHSVDLAGHFSGMFYTAAWL